jgi:hypothetical protein
LLQCFILSCGMDIRQARGRRHAAELIPGPISMLQVAGFSRAEEASGREPPSSHRPACDVTHAGWGARSTQLAGGLGARLVCLVAEVAALDLEARSRSVWLRTGAVGPNGAE